MFNPKTMPPNFGWASEEDHTEITTAKKQGKEEDGKRG